jgi:hypothetical protein
MSNILKLRLRQTWIVRLNCCPGRRSCTSNKLTLVRFLMSSYHTTTFGARSYILVPTWCYTCPPIRISNASSSWFLLLSLRFLSMMMVVVRDCHSSPSCQGTYSCRCTDSSCLVICRRRRRSIGWLGIWSLLLCVVAASDQVMIHWSSCSWNRWLVCSCTSRSICHL